VHGAFCLRRCYCVLAGFGIQCFFLWNLVGETISCIWDSMRKQISRAKNNPTNQRGPIWSQMIRRSSVTPRRTSAKWTDDGRWTASWRHENEARKSSRRKPEGGLPDVFFSGSFGDMLSFNCGSTYVRYSGSGQTSVERGNEQTNTPTRSSSYVYICA
jgi:hypothetical protein